LGAESLPTPVVVLDAVPVAGTVAVEAELETGVELALGDGEASATCVPSGGTSPTGFGRPSLLAAQAADAAMVNAPSTLVDRYLSNRTLSMISL